MFVMDSLLLLSIFFYQLKDLSVYHINVLSVCNTFTILIGYTFRLL